MFGKRSPSSESDEDRNSVSFHLDFLEKIGNDLEENPLNEEQQKKASALELRHRMRTFKRKQDQKKTLSLKYIKGACPGSIVAKKPRKVKKDYMSQQIHKFQRQTALSHIQRHNTGMGENLFQNFESPRTQRKPLFGSSQQLNALQLFEQPTAISQNEPI